jgi:Mrp family chromosome partitioning ATPase
VKKGETFRHAVTRLQGALQIVPVADTYQIAISLEGDKPEGLAEILNSVVATYCIQVKVEDFYGTDMRIRELNQDLQKMQREIAERQARRSGLAQKLGVSTFSETFVNPYDRLLIDAKEALAEARRKNIDAEAGLGAVDKQQRPGGAEALHAMALDMAAHDPALTSLDANINTRRTLLLSTTSGLTFEHPGRRAAEKELASMEQERRRVFDKLLNTYSAVIVNQRTADAYKTSRVEQKLGAEVDRQASQASWYSENYQDGLALGLEIERARKRLESIEDRINFLSLERRAPGFVRVFSKAQTPDTPVKGGRAKLFAMFLAAALVMGLIAPLAVDFLDPRMHSPADVANVLGFAPLAWLLDKKDSGDVFAREQIYRLANRLAQDREQNHSRIFAFTSVKARGGATTIVTETAAALTHLGLPCLAVEANAYRADPRYRDPRSRGLTVVLNGSRDMAEAIVPGDEDLPDHVPVGDLDNDRTIPDIQNLISILKQAADNYPLVLVDLPPLLVSVDAETIARNADVTVLVVEATAVTSGDLKRALQTLERQRPTAVAAVLNRVRLDEGGGFGRKALNEFQTGSTAKPAGLLNLLFRK